MGKHHRRQSAAGGHQVNQVFLLRCNGALIEVFSTEPKAVEYMRQHRKNSEHWRIEARNVS